MRKTFFTSLTLAAIAAFTLATSPLTANAKTADTPSTPLEVGDTIPLLSLKNPAGQALQYAHISGKNGTVLLFVRSLDWCPYCKKQVQQWNDNASAFVEAGYNVVAVSYDSARIASSFKEKHNITIPLLQDEGSKTIKAFGVLNADYAPDSRVYGIPNPHIYVINRAGKITHRYAEKSFKDRPDISIPQGDLIPQ